jgi:hypothetical protein
LGVSGCAYLCVGNGNAYFEWPASLPTGETSFGSISLGVYREKPLGTVQMKAFTGVRSSWPRRVRMLYLPVI